MMRRFLLFAMFLLLWLLVWMLACVLALGDIAPACADEMNGAMLHIGILSAVLFGGILSSLVKIDPL
jgi:hypothetical protein